ncbi:hypothetical protein BGZ97_007029 [Linnemannia gamsii]|uniref:Uncharacterized protein n=1 Tax=Linnemannia gamsii TaxID=64522 RepID=A0A9P6URQ9_9FUNG|nr:hypothetical protein BGZ97_007029 [Linnemannia gamsii]
MHSILVHRTNLIILLLNNNNNLNTNRTTSSKYNGSTSRSNSIINYINSGTDYLWTMLVPITPYGLNWPAKHWSSSAANDEVIDLT